MIETRKVIIDEIEVKGKYPGMKRMVSAAICPWCYEQIPMHPKTWRCPICGNEISWGMKRKCHSR